MTGLVEQCAAHEGLPRDRAGDAVDVELLGLLQGSDGLVGLVAEDAVDRDGTVVLVEEVLKAPDREVLVALL